MKRLFKFFTALLVSALMFGCSSTDKNTNTDDSTAAISVVTADIQYSFGSEKLENPIVSEAGIYFISYDISCSKRTSEISDYSMGVYVAPAGCNVSLYNANTHDVSMDEDTDCKKKLFTLNYSKYKKDIQFEIKIEKDDTKSVNLSSFITLYSYDGRIDGNDTINVENVRKENISLFHDVSTSGGICSGCTKNLNSSGLNIALRNRKYILQNIGTYFSRKLVIPNFVDEISEGAFEDSSIISVQLNDFITELKDNTFKNCKELQSVSLNLGLTIIGNSVFSGCSKLASIIIPDSVTSIGNDAFNGCSSLTSITIPYGVSSVGAYAFYDCSGLQSISVADSVTSIGNQAFKGCSGSLISIVIPNTVTSIGDYAFKGYSNLTSITIPSSVTSIGKGVFYGCSSLTSVIIPDGVTSIEEDVFNGCGSLTSITIPNSVMTIEENAFNDCSSLTSIIIPNSVTSIGENAFSGCSSLTTVTIPDSVTSIGRGAFRKCDSLTTMTLPFIRTYLGYIFGAQSSLYASNYVPSSLRNIILSNSCTNIGDSAFEGCSNLTTIIISSNITSIGSDAFYGCSGLTSIVIPNSVISIGYNAFSYCSGLNDIYYCGSVAEWNNISKSSAGIPSKATIHYNYVSE